MIPAMAVVSVFSLFSDRRRFVDVTMSQIMGAQQRVRYSHPAIKC